MSEEAPPSSRSSSASKPAPEFTFVGPTSTTGAVRLVFEGELDLEVADVLRTRLLGVIESGQDLELDLSRLTFIDSSGLGAIAEASNRTSEEQLVTIVAASTQVMRVLDVTGLRSVLGPPLGAEAQPNPAPSAAYLAAEHSLRQAESTNADAQRRGEVAPVSDRALTVLQRRVDAAIDVARSPQETAQAGRKTSRRWRRRSFPRA